jgi:hypothetical protein
MKSFFRFFANTHAGLLRHSTPFLLFIFFILYLSSCKKDTTDISSVSVQNKQAQNGPIPSYDFDWETATYMPSAASSSYNPIPVPWNSGTTAIDPNLVSDYKKNDGWKLVWNTFTPTTILGDQNYTYFFGLYNVYRGLLRVYLWHLANSNATTYVNHGLSLYGSGSPILNFNATDIVDASANKSTFTQILKQQMTSAQGTWFVFQYEMAYDPNMANTSFPSFGLSWQPQWVNLSNITLNGTQTGTIEGYVGNPNAGFNFGGLAQEGALTFLGKLNYAQLLGIVDAKDGEKPYTDAFNEASGGIVKGFFSGILGGSSSTQAVNLTINTQIKLQGNLISNGLVADKKFVMPGQSNNQTADGLIPIYSDVLGVFNVIGTPQINLAPNYWTNTVEDPYNGGVCDVSGCDLTMWLDDNSLNFVWNPAIINSSPSGATIQNIKKDIIALVPNGSGNEKIGNQEAISFNNLASGTPAYMSFGTGGSCTSLGLIYTPQFAVRVSFDVVPNNGAPKSTIVKTFLSNQL